MDTVIYHNKLCFLTSHYCLPYTPIFMTITDTNKENIYTRKLVLVITLLLWEQQTDQQVAFAF